MEKTKCYLCGADSPAILMKQNFKDKYLSLISEDYNSITRYIVVCKNCGFIYRSPQLGEEDIVTLYEKYRDTLFNNETPDEYFERIAGLPDSQSENHHKLLWLDKRIGSICRNIQGKVLEIGCGGGYY